MSQRLASSDDPPPASASIGAAPTSTRAAIDRAADHWHHGRIDAALACCRDALAIDPRCVDAIAHIGTIAWLRGDPDEAERLYGRARSIDPRHVGVLVNLATLRHEAGDLATARALLDEAAALRPGDADLTWRRSLLELAVGDYANGWRHYEAGLLQPALRGPGPGFRTPPWDGRSCDRLLLWHEQGLGDTIQFVRYARLCRTRARRVVVLCPPDLTALLRSCPWVDQAVDAVGEGDFDEHVSILSLPFRFGTTLETIPAEVPYLFADAARAAQRAEQVDAAAGPGDLKVGFVWAGNFRRDQARFHVIDRRRRVPLDALAPLWSIDGVRAYGLQRGDAVDDAVDQAADEAADDPVATPIVDAMVDVRDFADTAALVANLDLVISVDTSVAHLAGALGKPVWVLSRLDACWRWLGNRADSPWYPTATVYGQTTRGDWREPIERVARDLAALVSNRRAGRG